MWTSIRFHFYDKFIMKNHLEKLDKYYDKQTTKKNRKFITLFEGYEKVNGRSTLFRSPYFDCDVLSKYLSEFPKKDDISSYNGKYLILDRPSHYNHKDNVCTAGFFTYFSGEEDKEILGPNIEVQYYNMIDDDMHSSGMKYYNKRLIEKDKIKLFKQKYKEYMANEQH